MGVRFFSSKVTGALAISFRVSNFNFSYLLGLSFCLKFKTSNLLPKCLNFLTLFSIMLPLFSVYGKLTQNIEFSRV